MAQLVAAASPARRVPTYTRGETGLLGRHRRLLIFDHRVFEAAHTVTERTSDFEKTFRTKEYDRCYTQEQELDGLSRPVNT